MKIEEFQLHLTNLAHLLQSAKAKSIAEEFEAFAQSLQPYRERNLKEILTLLGKVEETARKAAEKEQKLIAENQKLKEEIKGLKAKKDPQLIEERQRQIVELYNTAGSLSVTSEQLETAFQELKALNLPVTKLKPLAVQMNITIKLAKPKLLEKIRETLLNRKGMSERVNV